MNPILLGGIAAVAWGAHDFAARFTGARIGALMTLLGVTGIGLLALTLWLVIAGAGLPALQPAELWRVGVMGVAFTLATLWLYEAVSRGPFALVSPIVGAYPVSALLFFVATGVRPSFDQWAAIFLVLIGVALVAIAAREEADATGPAGAQADDGTAAISAAALSSGELRRVIVFSALSHVAFAVAITAGQFAAPVYGELEATWLSRIFGLLLIVTLVLARAALRSIPLAWTPVVGAMGLADILALSAVSAAGNAPGAELATVVSSIFGIVAIVLARVFLGEKINRVQWLAIAIVFAGTAYLSAA
ncbi:MAG: DMT family transporter [Pseudomonadota bacterium]